MKDFNPEKRWEELKNITVEEVTDIYATMVEFDKIFSPWLTPDEKGRNTWKKDTPQYAKDARKKSYDLSIQFGQWR